MFCSIFEENSGTNGIVGVGYAPFSFHGKNIFRQNTGTSSLRVSQHIINNELWLFITRARLYLAFGGESKVGLLSTICRDPRVLSSALAVLKSLQPVCVTVSVSTDGRLGIQETFHLILLAQ